jgi:predicted O-methyltransferase YrrM
MKKFLRKKYQRLLSSINVMRFFYLIHYLTGGFYSKKTDISFEGKKKRSEIVKNILKYKNYKSYLEIGTFRDDLFNEVECEKKIGVDPVSGGNVRKTSDDFFLDNNDKFDLIFIDGLHHYEQTKKDITNSLNVLNEGGLILMHDCMPRNFYYQAVPRSQFNWNGDTYKAFLEFRAKDDYDSYCCYADEGIGVILKRRNKNKLKIDLKNFSKLNYNDYANNYKSYLNLIEYEDLINIIKDYE